MCRAAWRPDSAATSAVSAACTRLPAANTPASDVESVVSTAGPRVPGSMASPASRASSWSGIQSPVKTTTSHGTNRAAPVRASATSTPSSRSRPAIRRTVLQVHTGTRPRAGWPPRARCRPGRPARWSCTRPRCSAAPPPGSGRPARPAPTPGRRPTGARRPRPPRAGSAGASRPRRSDSRADSGPCRRRPREPARYPGRPAPSPRCSAFRSQGPAAASGSGDPAARRAARRGPRGPASGGGWPARRAGRRGCGARRAGPARSRRPGRPRPAWAARRPRPRPMPGRAAGAAGRCTPSPPAGARAARRAALAGPARSSPSRR